ncbi:hypothetical protein DWY31_07130 [Dorea sp. AF24-7LB]|uniref:hypothetical protein n=1 Tax=Dorea sp. AF24-7LB TaxID=2293097 RepID=UPI000E49A8E5|nr:hypothetical protein [Dorea sp. AF24-7LB]RHQ55709.1 hypothetical protein DWY31_07130 [Dorea sp. AF24-7LB]
MKNNRWKKALSVALVCCMLAGTGQGFTVHAQDEAAQEEAVVTAVKATPDTLPEDGGTITVKATGTGLTSENWGVEFDATLKEGGMSVSNKIQPTVKEVKKDTAIIEVPENPMRNDIDLKIKAGVKNGETIEEQAETTVLLEKKTRDMVEFPVEQIAQTGSNVITATFKEDIQFGYADMERVKSKIYIAKMHGTFEKIRTVSDEDEVIIEGNQLIVRFKEDFTKNELGVDSGLYVGAGALKNDDNKYNKEVSWSITTKPTISQIDLSKEVLDYQGGTVTATLKGVRVDEIDIEKDVEAYLTGAGETDAAVGTTLDVVKTENGLQMTVTVPENTTDNTMAYAINVKYKGMLVYEGNNGNPAKKAIISVLAKGTDPAKQTLATMTITGNNKDNTGDFNKDITVKVSPQVGELKTVLRLYGTNLDSKIVKVRAIDENGIIFPVYDIPE